MAVIRRRGNKYYLDYRYKARRCRKSVGSSKRVAELALADLRLKLDRDEAGLLTRSDVLLSQLIENYLQYSKSTKAESSFQRDCEILQVHFLPACKDCPLKNITMKTIEDYINQRVNQVSESTVNREMHTISNLFNKGIDWGYLLSNPCKGIKRLKEKSKAPVFLTTTEIQKLLESCDGLVYPVVKFALATGCRMGEIIHLEWGDINFEKRQIIIQDKDDWQTKSHRHRVIPITDDVVRMLVEKKDLSISKNVFSGPGGQRLAKMMIFRHYKKALKLVGLPAFDFKALRHTYASHIVMRGVNIRTVQRLMGHSSVKITERYAHLAPDHLDSVRNFLDFVPATKEVGHSLVTLSEKSSVSSKIPQGYRILRRPFTAVTRVQIPLGTLILIYLTR